MPSLSKLVTGAVCLLASSAWALDPYLADDALCPIERLRPKFGDTFPADSGGYYKTDVSVVPCQYGLVDITVLECVNDWVTNEIILSDVLCNPTLNASAVAARWAERNGDFSLSPFESEAQYRNVFGWLVHLLFAVIAFVSMSSCCCFGMQGMRGWRNLKGNIDLFKTQNKLDAKGGGVWEKQRGSEAENLLREINMTSADEATPAKYVVSTTGDKETSVPVKSDEPAAPVDPRGFVVALREYIDHYLHGRMMWIGGFEIFVGLAGTIALMVVPAARSGGNALFSRLVTMGLGGESAGTDAASIAFGLVLLTSAWIIMLGVVKILFAIHVISIHTMTFLTGLIYVGMTHNIWMLTFPYAHHVGEYVIRAMVAVALMALVTVMWLGWSSMQSSTKYPHAYDTLQGKGSDMGVVATEQTMHHDFGMQVMYTARRNVYGWMALNGLVFVAGMLLIPYHTDLVNLSFHHRDIGGSSYSWLLIAQGILWFVLLLVAMLLGCFIERKHGAVKSSWFPWVNTNLWL